MVARKSIRTGILSCLRNTDGYVSGEALRARFGVTRAAVWKQIEELRKRGYLIEGIPSSGYRLLSTPDLLNESEITQGGDHGRIGRRIHVVETTVSTNEDAWKLAQQGADEGVTVIAEEQTGGKGRRGRTWASPGGVNLYLSVILRPAIVPSHAPLVTLLAAVAIVDVLREEYAVQAGIKWPNDVLVGGKKIAGILSEMHAEVDRILFLVLGIGVNLNMTTEMFPEDMIYPATSLYLVTGKSVRRASFARALLARIDYWYETFLSGGSTPVRDAWLKACIHGGQILEVETAAGRQRGVFAGLDDDGSLVLNSIDGRRLRIYAGDVIRSVPSLS